MSRAGRHAPVGQMSPGAGFNHHYYLLTLFEVALEPGGLVILHLPVLDRPAAEAVVQLNGLDGGRAGLVLGRLRPEPEVEVPVEPVVSLGGLQMK